MRIWIIYQLQFVSLPPINLPIQLPDFDLGLNSESIPVERLHTLSSSFRTDQNLCLQISKRTDKCNHEN